MKRPKICASLINNDIRAVKDVASLVDLYEVRIDLIGAGWEELVPHLKKPWIACNRKMEEGGNWRGGEAARVNELVRAAERGAHIIDIELSTESIREIIAGLKGRAECLVSFHDMAGTPALSSLQDIVRKQRDAGADICKVVTTAQKFADNLTVLQLIAEFPGVRVVAFAMGPFGAASRVLCPLAGGDFVYASVGEGMEAASGQITVAALRNIYDMVRR